VLAADAESTTMELFEQLFAIDPRLRFLFPEDLHDQKHRLMSMIGFIVRKVERWDFVEPRLRNLGVRHVSYGVSAADYASFEQAMLAVLKKKLQLDDDSEVLRAWSALFHAVSNTMIDAALAGSEGRLAPEPA